MSTTTKNSRSKGTTIRLWTAQVLVAAIFLFAGGFKVLTPTDALAAMSHMNGEFVKFIGICETLGALGLVLPGLFRVRRELTPIAAAGLVIIMIGAVTITAARGEFAGVPLPAVLGVLATYIVRGRWSDAVRPNSLRPTVFRPAAQ